MCLSPPKPPSVPKQAPLPILKAPPPVKVQPSKPVETQPDAKPLADPEEKPKLDYGSKPSDALLSKKRTNKSIIKLEGTTSPGANQQGLGGTT